MSIFLRLAAGLLLLTRAVGGQQAAESWWNQPRGNAAGTGAVPLAGVHAHPLEEWRQPLGEILCEPVAWGGVVYAVARKDSERRLLAFRAQSGEPLGSLRLARGDRVELAVWRGTVVVVEGAEIASFSHRAGQLKSAKRLELERPLGSPCVQDGRLLIADGSELFCVDITSLKLVGRVPGGRGRPAVCDGQERATIATFSFESSEERDYLRLDHAALDHAGKAPKLGELPKSRLGIVQHGRESCVGQVLSLGLQSGEPLWYLRSPRALLAEGGGSFQACLSNGRLAPITSDAVVLEDRVIGFDAEGAMVRFGFDGRHGVVLAKKDLPPGARPGAPTAAGDVVYFGNWAVEVESGRVLWCLPELDPMTACVPTEDGRLAVGTSKGELIGYRDPNRSSGGATEVAAPPAARRPDEPGVVILRDASVLAGPLRRTAGGKLCVPGEDEEPRELGLDEIACAVTESGERVGSEEYPVFLAWRSVLFPELASAFETLAASYARERLIADARRLLQEALEYGLSPARQRALEDSLAGKPENADANAESKRKKKSADEHARREEAVQSFVAAADWCAARTPLCGHRAARSSPPPGARGSARRPARARRGAPARRVSRA